MPEEEDDDAKKGKKKGGSKGKKGKKGGSKDKKGKKGGSKDKKGKKGKSPKGKKGKSPKKDSEGDGSATEDGGGSGGGSDAGSSPKASPGAAAGGAAPAAGAGGGGAPGAPGAVQPMKMGGYYSEAHSMYDDGYDDDFYVDITCYPPRRGGGQAPSQAGGFGGYDDPYGYGRWAPPRPMQMPMGMGMWGGMQTRDVGQQMGPQTTTLPPGSPPMAFKTPSTTVVVNMSGERINRSGSRPMSPMMGMGGMGMGGMGGMGMGMGGMSMANMSPAMPGNKSPIVMSQPLTGTGLTPQMQQLLLRGMPGYTATVVLILVPNP
ncbi:collagen, type I, alpha 1b-like [Dermacentor albipictus]|uniref:collagen, type I, alpha 1b-like n=1 Tax=Dermacentor albipictus TaxID=60249 RepID=UPI0031FD1E0C